MTREDGPTRLRLMRFGERAMRWTAIAVLPSGREIEIGLLPNGLRVKRGSRWEDDVLEIDPEWLREEEP